MQRRRFVEASGVASAGPLTAGRTGGDETEATEIAAVTGTAGATDTGTEADGTGTGTDGLRGVDSDLV